MTKKIFYLILTTTVLLAFSVTACNNNKNDPDNSPEAVYTKAALTVAAQLTDMANENVEEGESTSTPEPAGDSTPTQTPDNESPTATKNSNQQATATLPQPTKSGSCTLLADFVSDITIPDDTILSPGESFTKTWQIMNSGTCTWDEGYTVFFVSGDNLNAPESVSLTRGVPVAEGTLINVSINLVAPSTEGSFRADFKFKDSSGKIFGTGAGGNGSVYVKITVAQPTLVPSNTPLPSETPTIEPTLAETATP